MAPHNGFLTKLFRKEGEGKENNSVQLFFIECVLEAKDDAGRYLGYRKK